MTFFFRNKRTLLLIPIAMLATNCRQRLPDNPGSKLNAQFLDAEGVMDNTTFVNAQVGGSCRDNEELEVIKTVEGLSAGDIRKFSKAHFNEGEEFIEPRRAEAWTLNVRADHRDGVQNKTPTIDEIDWGRKDHEMRESLPFTPYSIRRGRLRLTNGGNVRVNPSETFFVDVYYDTDNFDLFKARSVLRARVRFDNANEVSRLLIQAKVAAGVDVTTGLKKANKVDCRRNINSQCDDTTNCWNFVDQMDKMVKTGSAEPWSTGRKLRPMQFIYEFMQKNHPEALIGSKQELRLKAKAAVMSRRARFHYAKASSQTIRMYLGKAKVNADALIPMVESSNLPNKDEIKAFFEKISSEEIFTEVINPVLPAPTDPNAPALDWKAFDPRGPNNFNQDFNISRTVADKYSEVLHQAADMVAPLAEDSDVVQTMARQMEAAGSAMQALWMKNLDRSLFSGGDFPGDFLIDTLDYSQMMLIDDYKKMTNDEVRWTTPFDEDLNKHKVVFASIVNEVQIELTAIRALERIIRNPDETADRKKWAKFTLDQYMNGQTQITETRFEDIESAAEEADIDGIRWVTSAAAKGRIAIKFAVDAAKAASQQQPTPVPNPNPTPVPNPNPTPVPNPNPTPVPNPTPTPPPVP